MSLFRFDHWCFAVLAPPLSHICFVRLAECVLACVFACVYVCVCVCPCRYYWEIVVVCRKVLMVTVAVYFSYDLHIQALMAVLVVVCAAFLHALAAPFHERLLNQVEFLSLFCSFLTFFCGQFLFVEYLKAPERETQLWFISMTILIANVLFVGSVFVCMCMCIHACMRLCVCVCACVRMCMRLNACRCMRDVLSLLCLLDVCSPSDVCACVCEMLGAE